MNKKNLKDEYPYWLDDSKMPSAEESEKLRMLVDKEAEEKLDKMVDELVKKYLSED